MRPLVSILVPAYNAERWIAQTLHSALAQTWPNKEIIVVDDGSSDATVAIAREFEHVGVKVISQVNQGAAAARNIAYANCRGDYIQWLDADDLLAPDKIEQQMSSAATADRLTLLSSGWAHFAYRTCAAKFEATELWADQSPTEWLFHKLDKNLHMQTATWLTSRELADLAGPWNSEMLVDDDGEYFCRVLLKSDGIAFVPGARVYYRMTDRHRLSVINVSDRKMDAMLASMCAHIAALRSLEESERVRNACLKYLQRWLVVFYPERPDLVAKLEQLATDLQGHLTKPALSWKYSWIKAIMGWSAAKRAQLLLLHLKWSLQNHWDEVAFNLQRHLAGKSIVPGRQATELRGVLR